LKSNFRYWIASFLPSLASNLIQIQFLPIPGVTLQLMTRWRVTVPEALGPELASARLLILLLRRNPRRKCGTGHPESRLRSQLLTHLLLQLLRRVPGRGIISVDPTGRLNSNIPSHLISFFDFSHRIGPRGISFQTPMQRILR
jgi:hypothetical protein